jgi:hypothetical protein
MRREWKTREGPHREVEDAAALLEEAATLRIEEREAVEVDLLVVRLDLREVGVERDVQREIAGERMAHVETGLARGLAAACGTRPDCRRRAAARDRSGRTA